MATLANADTWEEIGIFAKEHEEFLKEYIELPNGIPSHDTIQRVMKMIEPKYFEQIQNKWNEMFETEEMQKIQKVISVDGKTMRENAGKGKKGNHIVTAWCDDYGYSLGETKVSEKTNEIKAIPELLDVINVKGNIVTIDAMGTQTKIAEKIIEKQADYVLAVKENQENLYREISEYLNDGELLENIKKSGGYKRTAEKSHGQIEIREYYQTEQTDWMQEKERKRDGKI